jgi:glycosyltransferase involved in cell wall biosynthesis
MILEIAVSGTVGTVHMGPVSTVICELSNQFAARGHQVTLADVACAEPRKLLHRDVTVVEMQNLPEGRVVAAISGRLARFVNVWRNYHDFVQQLTSRLDVSKQHAVHMHAMIPAFLLQRLHGVRGFYTAHTPLWSLAPDVSVKKMFRGRLAGWIERQVVRHADAAVGLGAYLGAAMPDAVVETIPNGLNLDAWTPIEKFAARQALGLRERDFVVVFAGRIQHVKGVDLLVEAIRSLAPQWPNLKAFAIGPASGAFETRDEFVDPYARKVAESAQGLPLRFLGFINNRETPFKQYLAAADVCVVPSRQEPQGMIVLESLAMGTPVIGGATGGIRDMIGAQVGYLFEPGNAGALAERIRTAYDNPDRLQRMRLAARPWVRDRYSWEEVGERYLRTFERRSSSRRGWT